MFQIGDADLGFSVQSTSKPFSYAMALEQLGAAEVHQWVGQEQSGGTFNDPRLSLDAAGKPQNPMINAGAIGDPRAGRVRPATCPSGSPRSSRPGPG